METQNNYKGGQESESPRKPSKAKIWIVILLGIVLGICCIICVPSAPSPFNQFVNELFDSYAAIMSGSCVASPIAIIFIILFNEISKRSEWIKTIGSSLSNWGTWVGIPANFFMFGFVMMGFSLAIGIFAKQYDFQTIALLLSMIILMIVLILFLNIKQSHIFLGAMGYLGAFVGGVLGLMLGLFLTYPSYFNAFVPSPLIPPEDDSPKLYSVEVRKESSTGDEIMYLDVRYQDINGDAEYIDWTLLDPTTNDVFLYDSYLKDAKERQIEGSSFSGTLYCLGGEQAVTLRVILRDKAGNESNPLEFELNCR